MLRILLKSAEVSLAATLVVISAFVFFLGSYTFIPTAAAASLNGIPAAQPAAWIAANTETVGGLGYAIFVVADPAMRSATMSGSVCVFVFGLVCAFASALHSLARGIAHKWAPTRDREGLAVWAGGVLATFRCKVLDASVGQA